MENFNIGDIVTVAENITLSNMDGSKTYEVKAGEQYEVVWTFKGIDGMGVLLQIRDFVTPFPCDDLLLIEHAQEKLRERTATITPEEISGILRNFVEKIPRDSEGYVWLINDIPVAAHSLEEAIAIFRSHACDAVIDSVKLYSRTRAYIQNEIPVV